jgi:hypothetical protein
VYPSCQTLGPKSVNTKSARSYATRVSTRSSLSEGSLVLSPPRGLESRLARAVRALPANAPPELCRERATPSCSKSVPLVKQSIQKRAFVHLRCFMQEKVPSSLPHALPRLGTHCCPPTSAVRKLVSKRVVVQRSRWRQPRPNPFIEGMPKRLRLLCTPHVKR